MNTNVKLLRFLGKYPLGGLRSPNFLPKKSCLRLLVCYSRLSSASNGTKQDNVQSNSRLSLYLPYFGQTIIGLIADKLMNETRSKLNLKITL